PELAADLELDAAALGNLSAVWFLTFALAQIPVGLALDRLGPRRTVAGMMCFAVAGAVLFALAPGAGVALLAQGLIGIGCAPVLMGMMVVAARCFPPERFAATTSILLGLGAGGNLLGATPMALATEAVGWRVTMLAIAALTAGATVLAFVLLKGPIGAAGEARGDSLGQALRGVGEVLRLRPLWPMLPLCFTSYAMLIAIRGLWAGPYLSEVFELTATARGNVLLAMAVAMVAGPLLYGPAQRLIVSEKRVVTLGNVVLALGLAGLALWPGTSVALSTLLLVAIGGFGMSYGILMGHGRRFIPDRLLGRGVSMLNLFFIGGVALVQPLSGLLVESLQAASTTPAAIYGALFAAMAAALAATIVVYLFSRERA
ncbi:MAG TPA: MFS transporter, partial [Geminicoccaceae bacterium]|nr:MFS transporter [Geminicoccaceae bacterium]